jgi:SAM-dependent methyltransferase
MSRRLYFWYRYMLGKAPWDTGVTPPEIVALVEEERLTPGRAIDLGCGTGTNAVYLALHGWEVVGIDYVPRPIRAAERKAARAGVAARTRFLVGDAARLPMMELGGRFDLAVDIGCGHSIPPEARSAYADGLAQVMKPGGVFMLYMFRPTPDRPTGLEPEAVADLFAPAFRLAWADMGEDRSARSASAWYRFERSGSP